MRYTLRIGTKVLLLSDAQLTKMCDAIEGVETMDEDYVGKEKGYVGHENNYVYKFGTFSASTDLQGAVKIIHEAEADKFRVLEQMRRAPKEGDAA